MSPVDAQSLSLAISITLDDPEVVAALSALPEGRRRDEFARSALRIGVLALQQAQGRIDTDVVRSEGDRLLTEMAHSLTKHQELLAGQVQGTLKEYFDPESGRFNERVKRLVQKDGELEEILRRSVGAADSEMTRTLQSHLGEQSPLLRMLSPDASKGVLASLHEIMKKELGDQRERILGQFSLDNADGALARFVTQLDTRNDVLAKGLTDRLDEVVGEFSLDDQDSALSRLVAQVEVAQRKISTELSLDAEGSGLARLKAELLGVLEKQGAASQRFQEEVKTTLATMQSRKIEAERSTLHGHDFELALGERLTEECAKTGDILQATGNSTGHIRLSKVGDFVVTLGPDARAKGATICIEAKKDAGYDLKKALEEIDVGRKNRGCEVGIFVWSRRSAPTGTPALSRHGNDVLVTWDAEDGTTDPYLLAAISLARALCTRAATEREQQAGDLEAMERAIRVIQKQAESLEEIDRSATTIKAGSEKILDRVRIAQRELLTQVRSLDETLMDLKSSASE